MITRCKKEVYALEVKDLTGRAAVRLFLEQVFRGNRVSGKHTNVTLLHCEQVIGNRSPPTPLATGRGCGIDRWILVAHAQGVV